MKFLLFGFDGLRPDLVTEQIMPNLKKFLDKNTNCVNSRSVFPTETYVNHPSIFTGFLPERHGLVGNVFFDSEASKKEYFMGSKVESVEMIDEQSGGNLFEVSTLTDNLTKAGYSYISISSNSPGSTRLMAHNVKTNGGVNISTSGVKYAYPEELRTAYGQGADYNSLKLPDLYGVNMINNIARNLFDSKGMADFNILWYGEPDNSFHEFGIGSSQSIVALKEADRCFGEIIERYFKDDVQVIVLSDHGHVTVGKNFNIIEAFMKRGLTPSRDLTFSEGDGFVPVYGYSGQIYVKNPSLVPKLVKMMQEMDEIGMIFTEDLNGVDGIIEGTFSKKLVACDNRRSAAIRYILDNWDEENEFGYSGMCYCPDFIHVGGSIHGGLHPKEVNSVMGFGGTMFNKDTVVNSITSVIDVAPTIYKLLGIIPDEKPHGKVVNEALVDGDVIIRKERVKTFYTGYKEYGQKITVAYIDKIPYFIEGERLKS